MPVPYFRAFPRFPLQAQFCSPTALAPSRGYFPIPGLFPHLGVHPLDQLQAAGAQGLWTAGLGPGSKAVFAMFGLRGERDVGGAVVAAI